jgi:peptidoglycan pentaglycine glycine transferase (the first glycine)
MTAGATAAAPRTDRWAAWDRFLETIPATGFMQSSWWAEFRLASGYEHFGAILKSDDAIIGGAVVMRFSYAPDHCFYYVPEGPVLPEDEGAAGDVFDAVLAAIDAQRHSEQLTVSHLRIEPRWQVRPQFLSAFRPPAVRDGFVEPRNTLCIDLRPSEAEILAQMKPKGRYNIHVAERHGVMVVEDASEQGLDDFLRIYQDMAARQDIKPKPPDYFQHLLALLMSHEKGSIFFAEHEGRRLAAALVVYFGRRATYFFGASLARDRHVMAPYRLHFEIMRRAKALGCEWYDLWGIAPEDDPDHPWRDITAFKRKFGGRAIDLVPTLDYVYDAAAYEHYVHTLSRPAAAE